MNKRSFGRTRLFTQSVFALLAGLQALPAQALVISADQWRSSEFGSPIRLAPGAPLAIPNYSPSSARGVFTPFAYKDPAVSARPNLQDAISDLTFDLRYNPLRRLTDVQLADVRLTFFSEVADVLNSAAAAAAGAGAPAPSAPSAACSQHLTASAQAVSGAPYCGDVAAAFASAGDACLDIAQPERFVHEGRAAGSVSFAELQTLEGMIKTVGDPVARLEFPGTLVNDQFRVQMRAILTKIRKNDLLSRTDQRLDVYSRAQQALAAHPDCAAEPSSARARLAALSAEAQALRASIVELDRAGRAQAEQDRKAVEARGRYRKKLPYASLTDSERQLLSMYLGALFWRARGGGLLDEPKGTQLTRLYFTMLPMRMLAQLNAGEDGPRVGESVFMDLFEPWSEWQDMGTMDGDKYGDLAGMSNRGRRQVHTAANMAQNAGYDPTDLAIGGRMMGACYYFAYDQLAKLKIGDQYSGPYKEFVTFPPEWGEACTGAVITLGMAKTLLNGYAGRLDR